MDLFQYAHVHHGESKANYVNNKDENKIIVCKSMF